MKPLAGVILAAWILYAFLLERDGDDLSGWAEALSREFQDD
jgi:hypothetical protein